MLLRKDFLSEENSRVERLHFNFYFGLACLHLKCFGPKFVAWHFPIKERAYAFVDLSWDGK